MGNSFDEFIYKLVVDNLTANNKLKIGNQSVLVNQGSSYFVDSGSGSSSNDGSSWSTALATLDQAINKCTANQGDIIYLAEGHTETYTTTGVKATFDIAGITVIGLGKGSDRPTFSYGHTGTTMTISAANTSIHNVLFVTAVDSVVTYATITGADCSIIDCESRDITDKEVITDFTATATADRFTMLRHFKNGYTSGNANVRVLSLAGVDNALIQDCVFMTKVTTAVIGFVTTACTNVVIKNCEFYVNSTTDFSKTVVDTITGSTWEVNNGFDLGAGSKFSGGSGAALAGDDVGSVSTDTTSIIAALYGANGVVTYPAAAAPANGVSLAEVLRDIWDVVRNGTGGSEPSTNLSIIDVLKQNAVRYTNPNYIAVTADFTSATWNTIATHEVFTVTGLVRMFVIAEVTGNGAGATATIELGNEASTGTWIAATTITDMASGEIWADATPTETEGNYSSLLFDKVVNAVDIGYEIKVAAATGGSIVFHCCWEAINSTGAVVAGAGGALV